MTRAAILTLALAALAAPATPAAAQTGIRIATWNLLGVGARGSAQYNAVRDTLNRLRPDAVGLQEVLGAAELTNLQNLAADTGYDVIVIQGANPFGDERNAILSRLPLVRSAINTSASLSGDPQANDLTRLIVEATLDVPGNARDFTLVSVHLKAGFNDSDEFRRAVEAIRAGQALADLNRQTDAYAIVGDCNEEVSSVPQNPNPFTALPSGMPAGWRLGTDLAAMLPAGIRNDPFHHMMLDTGADVSPLTAAQLDGSQATRPVSGRRIDYILASQSIFGLNPRAEVYDSADEGLPGGLPKFGSPLAPGTSAAASDHLIVFADITVPAGAHPPMHMVFAAPTSVPGVGIAGPLDVVRYTNATNTWTLPFRGSDYGLTTGAIDALAVLPSGHLLLSFADPLDIPGLTGGPGGSTLVDDSDIVEFTPPQTGFVITPSGPPRMFSFYLDGSDVGLDQDAEDIDAIEVLADGRILLSTTGAFTVPGVSGEDVDLIAFTPTSLGESTAGSFALHFDGSDVGLSGNTGEDVDAAAVTAGAIALSTLGDFFVTGVSGANEDVFRFSPTSLGTLTAGSYTLMLDLSILGIDPAADLIALDVDD